MGYFNSLFSLLQDGSTYLNGHPLDMLAEGSHLQCLNHKPRKNCHVQQVTCWSLRPLTCGQHHPNIDTSNPTGRQRMVIHSGSDLRFIFTFSLLDLGMGELLICQKKKSCGKWLQKWCQVLQACLIFKRSSFPNLENKNIDQKVPRFPTKTQKRFAKKKKTFALQVLKRCTGPPWWKVQCTKHSFT